MKYHNITYVVSYINLQENKKRIYKENKNKSGVYMLTNLINKKSYIGSSRSLSNRFYSHFCLNYTKRKIRNSADTIYKSLSEYGYKEFELTIIEYCHEENLIIREQYYINLLKPEYNILKSAGSNLGHKHLEETKIKISEKVKGANNPSFGKEPKEETRKKIGESLKYYHSNNTYIKKKSYIRSIETKQKLSLRSKGVRIDIFNKENQFIQSFPTITSAAKYYNISNRTISRRLMKGYCNKFIYITSN